MVRFRAGVPGRQRELFMTTRRLLVAGAAASLLSACAETFFFYPSRGAAGRQRGDAVEDMFFDSGGLRLHGWWMPAQGGARATVVHAHGNSGNVSLHAPQVSWLTAAGLNVLTFDYRGFGQSEGVPSLSGIVADTRAAIARARGLDSTLPIVLLGQSLGGATAIRAAADAQEEVVRFLVLDSAFASYRGIVRDTVQLGVLALIPLYVVPSLPGRVSDPVSVMARLRMPVLLLHGESDRVVPIDHSERLHAAATGPKQLIRIRGGEHLDALSREEVRREVLAAIQAVL